ncbi:uncharacterized protein RSE6_07538 [Rhynchosporium secalis]|uniref:Uncharacterized protein n=1 Tax=Rhynchosporium secalis TaxID=38038 RepID=A0A1E1ME77_RHYSE|nr:uncharacterized protein RSE6_07538 [Rhynchosporium secalis]
MRQGKTRQERVAESSLDPPQKPEGSSAEGAEQSDVIKCGLLRRTDKKLHDCLYIGRKCKQAIGQLRAISMCLKMRSQVDEGRMSSLIVWSPCTESETQRDATGIIVQCLSRWLMSSPQRFVGVSYRGQGRG